MIEHDLWSVFASVARAIDDRDAVVWRGRRWSYGALLERASRLANVLHAHGLGVHRERAQLEPWESGQDLLACYLLNGPEYLEATLAGYGARVAPFNVNYRYVADELAHVFEDAGAGAVVYHATFAPTLAQVLPRLTRQPLLLQVADESGNELIPGAVDYEAALQGAPSTPPPVTPTPDDLYVLYTGGTTGMPKGTLWRQADIWNAALGGVTLGENADLDAIVASAVAGGGSRFLPNAPFMHGAAHWLGLRFVLTGDTVVVNDIVDRLDPAEVWETVARERIDTTLMVGEAIARPLVAELETGRHDASSIRLVVVGGGITSPETKARLLAALPQALVLDAAGASETGSALSSISSAAGTAEGGVFMPTPSVRVLDEDRQRCLEPGEDATGWFAKSGRIPLGYLGDRAKTEATFPVVAGVRYSVPGDRARLRADGMVELLGRESVTINTGGEKVFAEEVEQALLTHPDLEDAVVTGRPHERWGQEVVAVVSVRPGSDPDDDDLLRVAGERIARFKLPKEIVRVAAVRRSPAGKADYAWARAVATGEA